MVRARKGVWTLLLEPPTGACRTRNAHAAPRTRMWLLGLRVLLHDDTCMVYSQHTGEWAPFRDNSVALAAATAFKSNDVRGGMDILREASSTAMLSDARLRDAFIVALCEGATLSGSVSPFRLVLSLIDEAKADGGASLGAKAFGGVFRALKACGGAAPAPVIGEVSVEEAGALRVGVCGAEELLADPRERKALGVVSWYPC